MEQLRFVFKDTKVKTVSSARIKGNADVGVTYTKNETKGDLVSLTFRNGTAEKIAPNTSSIGWAISGHRLYFQEAPEKIGYKLTTVRGGENKYLQLAGKKHQKEIKWAKKHGGQYALNWDEARCLWYIDTEVLQFVTMIGGEKI